MVKQLEIPYAYNLRKKRKGGPQKAKAIKNPKKGGPRKKARARKNQKERDPNKIDLNSNT